MVLSQYTRWAKECLFLHRLRVGQVLRHSRAVRHPQVDSSPRLKTLDFVLNNPSSDIKLDFILEQQYKYIFYLTYFSKFQ